MNNKTRIPYIDGLKGLACLGVFWSHYITTVVPDTKVFFNLPFIHLLVMADVDVHLFIMLSGILVYRSMMNKDYNQYGEIFIKRYFRFAVPFAFAILFSYLIWSWGGYYAEEFGSKIGNAKWVHLYSYVNAKALLKALIFSPVMGAGQILNPLWMIKYIFYGCFAIACLHMMTKSMTVIRKCAVLLFSIICLSRFSIYMIGIPAGMILCVLIDELSSYNRKYLQRAISLVSLFGVLYLSTMPVVKGNFLQAVIAILLIMAVFCSTFLQKLFSTAPMLFFGKISMWLYLIHFPLISSIGCYMALHMTNDWIEFSILNVFVIIVSFLLTRYLDPICNPIVKQVTSLIIK